jgi:DNA-directed RNA polymerase subunit RPC12/RpoP
VIKPYECTQCGATDFLDVEAGRVRCASCGSLFEVLTREPRVVINKGAHVVFGKNANVEIRGDMQVQDGAEVNVEGKVTVLSDGKQREFKLKKVKE